MKSRVVINIITIAAFSMLGSLKAEAGEPVKKVIATEAPVEASEMINKTTCVSGSDRRELEIVGKDGGHVVNYTKAGETKEVGSCLTSKEKCQKIFDGIKSNLEAAGYSCQT